MTDAMMSEIDQETLTQGQNEAASPASQTWSQYVTFKIDDRSYGIEITKVREIKGWSAPTELPMHFNDSLRERPQTCALALSYNLGRRSRLSGVDLAFLAPHSGLIVGLNRASPAFAHPAIGQSLSCDSEATNAMMRALTSSGASSRMACL